MKYRAFHFGIVRRVVDLVEHLPVAIVAVDTQPVNGFLLEFRVGRAVGNGKQDLLRLGGLRRAVESVEVNDHALVVGAARNEREASSSSWIPPNPPFDMTRT